MSAASPPALISSLSNEPADAVVKRDAYRQVQSATGADPVSEVGLAKH
jgi:hypothetical protein